MEKNLDVTKYAFSNTNDTEMHLANKALDDRVKGNLRDKRGKMPPNNKNEPINQALNTKHRTKNKK